MNLDRRGVLKSLAAYGSLYSILAGSASLDAILQRIGDNDPDASPAQRTALRGVRFLNSAQARYAGETMQYASLSELLQSEQFRRLGGSTALSQNASTLEDLIDGFKTSVRMNADRSSYTILTEERAGHFALLTNETGVIRVGQVVDSEFIGEPLVEGAVLRGNPSGKGSRVRQVGARLSQWLMPTLHANPSCCGVCGGHCFSENASSCGMNCATCCNLGFSNCPWCCNVDCGCLGC